MKVAARAAKPRPATLPVVQHPEPAPPDAIAAAPAAPAVSGAPARASAVIAARPVAGIEGDCTPDYPPMARMRGQSGRTMILATVSPEGRAVAARVTSSSGHKLLDSAALAQVLGHCRFVPASINGVPVQGNALVPVDFTLQ